MKAPSPLVGFNNNLKHKGCVYHVQTEDSGIKYPHIITHLFADGGRILKSVKTSYSSIVGHPAMAEIVRALMKEQHKAMIIALRQGQFEADGAGEVLAPNIEIFVTKYTKQPSVAESTKAPSSQPEDPLLTHSPLSIDVHDLEEATLAQAQLARTYHDVELHPPSSKHIAQKLAQGQYAHTKTAALFAQEPIWKTDSLHEDELIHLSLGEVVLRFLTEDLKANPEAAGAIALINTKEKIQNKTK